MFRITLAIAVLIAACLDSRSNAEQEIDSLVDSLTFGEPNEPLMRQTPHEAQLAPASGQRLTSTQGHATDYGLEIPPDSPSPPEAPALPQPIVEAPPASPTVNFNQYFAAGGMGDACISRSPALLCDAPVLSRPHHAPNLPPPSSMLQYFQSDNCYSDIWTGYAAERQKRCVHMHKHIHGTCDCFTNSNCQCGCQKHCAGGHSH